MNLSAHTPTWRPRAVALAFALALALVGTSCSSPEKQPAKPERSIEPRVTELLATLNAQLLERDRGRVELTETMRVLDDAGQRIELTNLCKAAIDRPGRLYIESEGDLGHLGLWKDGELVTRVDFDANTYEQIADPGTIDDLLVDPSFLVRGFPPITGLLSDDIEHMLTRDMTLGRYLGLHLAGEVPCHHIALQGDLQDIQLWLFEQDDGSLRVKKMVVAYHISETRPWSSMQILISTPESEIPDSAFEAVIPEGAVRVGPGADTTGAAGAADPG